MSNLELYKAIDLEKFNNTGKISWRLSPKVIWYIKSWKDGCPWKTEKIGIAIEDEYQKLPKNANIQLGVCDDSEYEDKIIKTLTADEILRICGTH
jgi:hypothetical protein